jgi:Domain of unknown function (DUF1929)
LLVGLLVFASIPFLLTAPYVFKPELRPTIVSIDSDTAGSTEHRFGDTIRVRYDGPVVTGATITSPGAVTHGTEMNSRTSFLEIFNRDDANDDEVRRRDRDLRRPNIKRRVGSMKSNDRNSREQVNDHGGGGDTDADGTATGSYIDLVLPQRHHRVTAPGWHMLFLLHEKSPSHEAIWIKLVDDNLETADQ